MLDEGAGESPNMSQVAKNSKPAGSGEPYDRQQGLVASAAADCNEYMRSLHKQLVKVLKSKPVPVPTDGG